MYLVQKAFYLWLGVFFALVIVYGYERKTSTAVYLPISEPILTITMSDNLELHRQDLHSPWYVNEQPANDDKVDALIERLKQPCSAVYDQKEIKNISDSQAIQFKVGNETYLIGQHQPISQTHYIYHAQEVYLCHESIKYTLTQPLERWLKGH